MTVTAGRRTSAVERGGEAGQARRADQEPEVAQGDVVEVRLEQQVGDDPGQPGGDEVAAELRAHGDDEAGDDLDDADGEHRLVGVAGDEVVDLRRQVDPPVDEPVEELVQPEQDRGDGEADAQERERLVGGVGEPGLGGRRGRTLVGRSVIVAIGLLL